MQPRVGRNLAESAGPEDFLRAAAGAPSGLILEGEPGIGKTTLWLALGEAAQAQGFRVLSTRGAPLESVLAYAALADLLGAVNDANDVALPDPQQRAIDRVLLRANHDNAAVDQHAVAAGFLSIVNHLATQSPLLIAIDDLQWLDSSSASAVAFAVRRLSGRVGVLGTVRTAPDGTDAASWLELSRPDWTRRVRLRPMSLRALHATLCERLGRSFPHPTMVRIHEVSGGNPLYAIELARALDGNDDVQVALPGTLAAAIRTRIDGFDSAGQEILLAMACTATPTVEVVAHAVEREVSGVMQQLELAESQGVIALAGNQLRFTHPLLARGVYDHAGPARRRAMHRRLATIVDHPELRARHLALAAVAGEPATLAALDHAAQTARFRGAPAAAAELVDLAIGLGGDSAERRIRSAQYHFDAGSIQRARDSLGEMIDGLGPGPLRAEALNLLGTLNLLGAGYFEAIELLKRALDEPGPDRQLRAQTLVTLALAYLNTGSLDLADRHIDAAIADAAELGQTQLMSQALGIRALLRFVSGDGLDEASLQQALDLEDASVAMPAAFRPSMQNALLLAGTGRLDDARDQVAAVRQASLERGDESEQLFAEFYGIVIEIWSGNFSAAALQAEDAVDRATQLGGDASLFSGLSIRAALAAYAGRAADARRDTAEAIAAGQRSGSTTLIV